MVKVFPGNFSFFEKQDILTPDSGEPLAITCSDEFLFVAEEGCLLEVYDLATLQLVARFRTVSPVVDFVYNAKGDCIVTVESKSPGSHGFARIYFKWRGSSVDKPMRVSLLESLSRGLMQSAATQDRIAAEIVELPAEYNSSVTCLACCKESGRIAVGMDTTIRVFSLCPEIEGEGGGGGGGPSVSTPMSSPQHSRLRNSPTKAGGKVISHSIEILLDIKTSIPLSKISIFNDYIAFISPFEARVLKLSFLAHPVPPPTATLREQPFSTLRKETSTSRLTSSEDESLPRVASRSRRNDVQSDSVKMDPNFVLWSPSKVWEVEKFSASYTMSLSGNGANSPFLNVLPHRPTISRSHMTSHDPRRSPVVGTISLQSVGQSTSLKTSDQHDLEVLGPSEYVWGQPIDVSIEESISEEPVVPPQCRVLTMLYRRFTPTVNRQQSETESLRTKSLTLPSRNTLQQQHLPSIGLHSVQLLPTIVSDASGTPQLAGISCFIANMFHGYLYDVHVKTRLVSSFSFMSKMETIVADCSFLHALSGDSVETYTNRSFQAAVWSQSGGSGKEDTGDEVDEDIAPEHAQWMKQPCPPPNMDLTLVSASKFVGSCRLATSTDYVIVLTKSVDSSPSQAAGSKWLLQSLSIRKPAIEPTWNVYILKKKDPMALYHHFLEYANSLKANSPPMYQHVLSECHALLRSQLVQNSTLSPTLVTDMVQTLHGNCHSLADSLCTYSTDTPSAAALNGARYFTLSGAHISDVVQHVITTYSKDSAKAYSVLMSYLNLILFDHPGNHSNHAPTPGHVTNAGTGGVSRQLLSPLLADSLVEIYAEHRPEQLTNFFLHSWVKNYSPEKALGLLNRSSQSPRQLQKIQLCQALLLLRINSMERLREKLVQLPDEFLTSWLKKNHQFAVDASSARLTEFGKVLQLHKENCLLDVLSHCLSTGYLSFQLLCQLLQADSTGQDELADNVVLKQFLDRIILDRIPVKGGLDPGEKQKAMILLVDVLMARLSSSRSPRPSTATPFSLYGSRHKWLDNLPPFDGSVSKVSQSLLQDLMQLQALLCRSEGVEVTGHLETVMEEAGLKMEEGALSLQLLSFPHTGKIKQAIQLVLRYAPVLTVEYCLTYLPPQLDHWKDLLASLLDICTSHDQQGSSANPQLVEIHRSLYKAALNHVLTVTTPEEFMALLPPSGSINFYLPFIEHSCKLYLSRQVAEELHSNTSLHH